ncbi:Uu.00g142890.m01.CDS01 [Anthostomella pinea]|uniref:Uu.00g142890.m01.CDS01 n=1 Tax=Anthostomella pinea TaxID=933095 RepID=A0AAI8VQJ6_9PEZI|nr:Uu.00g142890.m01.CDS01 [Anthostomella pinea]
MVIIGDGREQRISTVSNVRLGPLGDGHRPGCWIHDASAANHVAAAGYDDLRAPSLLASEIVIYPDLPKDGRGE